MGSKRWMLRNGLGTTLDQYTARYSRFHDLFAGSGAVSFHIATRHQIPVYAYDLQKFSSVLTQSILGRTSRVDHEKIWKTWEADAKNIVRRYRYPDSENFTRDYVERCRLWSKSRHSMPITKAYGGHYFSPRQTIWLDALRKTIPRSKPNSLVALAALISVSSKCAASPGHTAQPFQPTSTAIRYIEEAWNKDICANTRSALSLISDQYALEKGTSKTTDANRAATQLREGDLVFIDPPYSGVHYSRFYHVLETVADGECGAVTGVGRYPSSDKRPRSSYSMKSESAAAISKIFDTISQKKAHAIVTFPSHECSNGLSGDFIRSEANKFFQVEEKIVNSKFSTLGGTSHGSSRSARQQAEELILILT